MENQPTLKRSLTLFQVVFLGLAWMTPMIFFTSFGISYESSKGMLTVAYLLAFLAIFFTASSYGKMAKAFPVSGSALTYITKVTNPFIGFLVGWVILLDYLFSCIIANLMFGINLHAQFPSVPSYIWIILLDILLMVINIIGIKTSANISKLFVCIQIAFIALFCILVFHNLLQNDTSVHLAGPFVMGDSITFSTILAGASIICFSFLGFDSITAMAEETINPKKNIPRAIMIIISVAGILYFSTSYFLQLAYPELKFSNPDTAGFYVANLVGGKILGAIFTTVLVFAVFTQGLSSVATVTRLLYVMGRSTQLPKKSFGYLHPKFRTPVYNVVLVSVISLLGLFISLDTCIKFVNFGALTAFMFVNLSVILHYFIKEKRRTLKGIIAYLVSPLIGAGFIFYLLTLLDKDSLLMGLSWLALGLMYSLYLAARKKKRALVKEQENVTVTVE